MPKITVNDIEMYYEISGNGEPLLLIHGLGSSTRDWEEMIPFLLKFQIISLDLRGHGRSSKPKGKYTVKMFANDIITLLNEIKVTSTHILGISLGGAIALQLAVDFPEYVKGLIVINSGPELLVDSFKKKMEVFKRKLIVRLVGMKKMGEVLATRLFIKPEQYKQREILIERWAENDKRAYISSMCALPGWSVKNQLKNIKSPTLIIGSDEDYSPSSVKQECSNLIPNGKFIEIKDARHAVTAEKPEEVSKIVNDFLS